jgi:hypothetical protein
MRDIYRQYPNDQILPNWDDDPLSSFPLVECLECANSKGGRSLVVVSNIECFFSGHWHLEENRYRNNARKR